MIFMKEKIETKVKWKVVLNQLLIKKLKQIYQQIYKTAKSVYKYQK